MLGGIVGYSIELNMNNCCNKGKIISNATGIDYYLIGMIAGANYDNGLIQNCFYLKQEDYPGIATTTGIDETVSIEKESDMPNILDILGSSYKNGSLDYPVLSWEK